VGKEITEERRMPDEDELTALREEIETLAAFLHALQREHARLKADLAAVLHTVGGQIEVPSIAIQPSSRAQQIERTVNPVTRVVTFRLVPKD
jgi:predicted  nucleic acid-binding Zn-ribbon protein